MGIDSACQFERMVAGNGFRIDDNGLGTTLGIDERGIGLALRAQALNVNLCRLQLRLERETVTALPPYTTSCVDSPKPHDE